MKTIEFDVDGYYVDILSRDIYKCISRDESGKVKFECTSLFESKQTRLYRPQEINYGDYKVEVIETKNLTLHADYYCL